MFDKEQLLSIQQCAILIGHSAHWVKRRLKIDRAFPPIQKQIGRARFVNAAEYRAWVENYLSEAPEDEEDDLCRYREPDSDKLKKLNNEFLRLLRAEAGGRSSA